MFNKTLIAVLIKQNDELRRELAELRSRYDQKIEDLYLEGDARVRAERERFDHEIRLSRVREQGLIDRFFLKNGVPQLYDTVPADQEQGETRANTGMRPGAASIQYYKNLENSLWGDSMEEQLRHQMAESTQNLVTELIGDES